MQLIEVELPHLVDVLALDREQQPRRAQPCATAVGADVLDHDLVEPRFHPRIGFAPLPIAAVLALDAPGNAVEADFLAFVIVALDLGFGRRGEARLSSDRSRRGSHCRAFSVRSFHGVSSEKFRLFDEAVHHPAVPGVGVVLECLLHEAAADDAALWIGNRAAPDASACPRRAHRTCGRRSRDR